MAREETKAELRARIRAERRGPETGGPGLARALGDAWHGRSLAAYLPLPGEPDVAPALEAATARGAELWLPVTVVDAPLMWARWEAGFSLRSPGTETPLERLVGPRMRAHRDGAEVAALADDEEVVSSAALATRIDLLLAPALAVDEDGVRLGQGGGYFDRSFGPLGLANLGRVPVWACVHEREILPRGTLPVAPHDLRVDAALTPSGLRPLAARA